MENLTLRTFLAIQPSNPPPSVQCIVACSARTNRVTNILEKIGKCTHKIPAVNHPEVGKDILNIDFQFLTYLNTILDWRVSLKQSIDVPHKDITIK